MRCPVCDYNGNGGPSDHEPWCPAFMRGAVDLEGEQLPFEEDAPFCPCGDRTCGWGGPEDELVEHVAWMSYVTPPNPLYDAQRRATVPTN